MSSKASFRLAASCAFAFAAIFSARAAELPIYPVDANCREATDLFFEGSKLSAARRDAFRQDCVRRQQEAYDAVKHVWPTLQAADQAACLRIERNPNYLQLERCVSDLYQQELSMRRTDNRPFEP